MPESPRGTFLFSRQSVLKTILIVSSSSCIIFLYHLLVSSQKEALRGINLLPALRTQIVRLSHAVHAARAVHMPTSAKRLRQKAVDTGFRGQNRASGPLGFTDTLPY